MSKVMSRTRETMAYGFAPRIFGGGALVEQLGLLVDKVRSNKGVEFFGHAKVACAFPRPVWSGSINNIPREFVIDSFVS